jgi:hypothetical protein
MSQSHLLSLASSALAGAWGVRFGGGTALAGAMRPDGRGISQ